MDVFSIYPVQPLFFSRQQLVLKNEELGMNTLMATYRFVCVYIGTHTHTYIQTVPRAHTNLKQARLFIKR